MMEPLKILIIIDLDELLDVLDEVEGKAVIWAHYQHDVESIIKRIRKEYTFDSAVDYYGLTPTSERQKNIKKFQNDDKCRFFVGTTQTGGLWYHLDGCKYNDLLFQWL